MTLLEPNTSPTVIWLTTVGSGLTVSGLFLYFLVLVLFPTPPLIPDGLLQDAMLLVLFPIGVVMVASAYFLGYQMKTHRGYRQ